MGTCYFCSNFLLFKLLHSPAQGHRPCSLSAAHRHPATTHLGLFPEEPQKRCINTHRQTHRAVWQSVSWQHQSCPHTRTGEAPKPSQSCQRSGLSQQGNAPGPRAEGTAPCQRAEAVLLAEGKPERPRHFIATTVPALTSLAVA